ncbi:hypothetical protein MPSEU_000636500 [Mayamaea pseudoterrestris]|nr:hypothetical protein MPSEU_000636500 [Mayamaea pseudoterrestris]
MADHAECAEEQQYEAEALEAIYDTQFTKTSSDDEGRPQWQIELLPDTSNDDESNHVGCKLIVNLPLDYPHANLPQLSVQVTRGLAPEHASILETLAQEEAKANEGAPSIFAVAERIKEWLVENNVKGLDDTSMYAQSMRKATQPVAKVSTEFEAQVHVDKMTETEVEDYEVQKRRAEGTPCNKENFEVWKRRFEAEMAETVALKDATEADGQTRRVKDKKIEDKTGRVTGFLQFSGAASNLQALEAAADEAERDETPIIDEELFDDDEDLDDLDFDSDDDDDVDDDEGSEDDEELDI